MLPTLKIKKLYEGAVIPEHKNKQTGWLPLTIDEDVVIFSQDICEVHTGIAVQIPTGYHGEIHTTSYLGQHSINLANSTKIIDETYMGEVCLLLRNSGADACHLKKGQVIAKLGLIKDPVFNMTVVETFNNEEIMEDED